jgi:hypothetical protein
MACSSFWLQSRLLVTYVRVRVLRSTSGDGKSSPSQTWYYDRSLIPFSAFALASSSFFIYIIIRIMFMWVFVRVLNFVNASLYCNRNIAQTNGWIPEIVPPMNDDRQFQVSEPTTQKRRFFPRISKSPWGLPRKVVMRSFLRSRRVSLGWLPT